MLNRIGLNSSLSAKYIFILAGVFFAFLGLLLMDRQLSFAGNVILTIGVLSSIKDLKNIHALSLFILGFLVSFKFPVLSLLLEALSLVLWSQKKVFSIMQSPYALLKHICKR